MDGCFRRSRILTQPPVPVNMRAFSKIRLQSGPQGLSNSRQSDKQEMFCGLIA
jgi:hypothetical protein